MNLGVRRADDRAAGAVGTPHVGLVFVVQATDVGHAPLASCGGAHRLALVPVQAEVQPGLVRVLRRLGHAGRPTLRIRLGLIARPPADINHDLLEPQRRDVINQRVKLRLRALPAARQNSGRAKRVPLHLRVARILAHHRRQAVVPEITAQAVAGIADVAAVGANETGRRDETLAGREGDLGLRPVAAAHLQSPVAVSFGDDLAEAPLDADVHAMLTTDIEHGVRNELAVGMCANLASGSRLQLVPINAGAVRRFAAGVKGPHCQRPFPGQLYIKCGRLTEDDRFVGPIGDLHRMPDRSASRRGLPNRGQFQRGLLARKLQRHLAGHLLRVLELPRKCRQRERLGLPHPVPARGRVAQLLLAKLSRGRQAQRQLRVIGRQRPRVLAGSEGGGAAENRDGHGANQLLHCCWFVRALGNTVRRSRVQPHGTSVTNSRRPRRPAKLSGAGNGGVYW